MKLVNVAAVYSGLSFREKIVHDPIGDVSVIQMRNLTNDFSGIEPEVDRMQDSGIKPKYFLEKGDILLVAKGANNHAILFEDFPERAIASASFFIIKTKPNKVLPGYLYWYLNHPLTQNTLKQKQSGTYTPSLKIDALKELNIPLPDTNKQTKIAKLYRLQMREKHLQSQLMINRQNLMDNMLISAIQ